MKKLRYILILILLVTGAYFWLMQDFAQQESTLIFNGQMITMEPGLEEPEAIYVEEGKIKAMGSYDELGTFTNPQTEMLDLKGKTLLPGFIDSHSHAVASSFLHNMIDLSGFTHKSPAEVWNHLEASVASFKKGEWIVCKGLDPILVNGLRPPHISYLDSIAPDNPLLILAQSLHSQWGNTRAFEKVGIDKHTPDPSSSSYYEKDEEGNLTGFIAEQEAFVPFRLELVEAGRETLLNSIVEVMDDYVAHGNTTIATLGISSNDPNVVMLYKHLSSEKPNFLGQVLAQFGLLPKRKPGPRHFAYIREDAINLLPESVDNGDDSFKILGVKLWYDGSPYTGSMYMKEPYISSKLTKRGFLIPDNYRGEALMTKEKLQQVISTYRAEGWQIAIHAQGDLAIMEIIEALEGIADGKGAFENRTRLEHCLLLGEESIQKMKSLNISPNFHINHLLYYGKALREDILGEERAKKILPIRSAADAGLTYAMHADQPMFLSDPLSLLATSVQRTTEQGDTLGYDQAISILQALKGLTIHAAWQLKMEDKIGSIKEGKYADFVVLNQNPFTIQKKELRNLQVVQTIVNGNTVYKK